MDPWTMYRLMFLLDLCIRRNHRPVMSLLQTRASTIQPLMVFFSFSIYRISCRQHTGKPCNKDGEFINPMSAPLAQDVLDPDDWSPFRDDVAFRAAELFFKDDQTSAGKIDQFLDLWADSLAIHGDEPPFSDHKDLYNTIDAIPIGGVPWQSSVFNYDGPQPEQDIPKWMATDYTIWYRDPRQLFKRMLENPDFANDFDYAPLRQYDDTGKREYKNFMSGDWGWTQAVSPLLAVWISCSDKSIS
jgi:hypothetical protein